MVDRNGPEISHRANRKKLIVYGVSALLLCGLALSIPAALAEPTPTKAVADKQPVSKEGTKDATKVEGGEHDTKKDATAPDSHPLDPALKVARDGLQYIKENVRDYTCTIIKRERVNNELGEHQFMFAKIRHAQKGNGSPDVPFSVYLKFLKPRSVQGREVIWVDGRNDGKMVAHEGGLLNFKRVWLAPDGYLAMVGQRYPIGEIGVQNLVEELIARGERDRKFKDVEVKFFTGAKVNERICRMIQVVHPEKQPHFDFHKVQIFIDEEMNIPVRYAAWTWPEKPGGEPLLLEEYTYVDVKLNVGLTDEDFNPDNKEYNYPRL